MPRRFLPILDALDHRYPDLDDPVGLVLSGRVLADGRPVTNPASRVATDAVVTIERDRVLRGTRKLESALHAFDCATADRVAVDVGASTGGFTIALLAAGVRRVYAVDAGHGQLLGSLRQDPRVVNLEHTNLGVLGPDLIPEPVAIITVDLSNLAITEAIPQLEVLTIAPDADLIALVKPMFELRLAALPHDAAQLRAAVDRAATAIRAYGWNVVARTESSPRGRHGAIEFFVHARRRGITPWSR